MKAVEHDLVADHVLDVVGHHGGRGTQDIDAKIAICERSEGLMRGCNSGAGTGIWAQGSNVGKCVVGEL